MMKKALFVILCVLLDQFVKYVIRSFLSFGEVVTLFPGVFFTYQTNTGAAFGMLQGQSFLITVVSIAVLVFLYLDRKSFSTPHSSIGYVLIVSGILGNLIDRFLFGFVTDFIGVWLWPIFNFADSYLTVGTILIMFVLFNEKPHFVLIKKGKDTITKKGELLTSAWRQGFGLMFSKEKDDFGLIFDLHSMRSILVTMWFVFYPIDVIFIDSHKKIIDAVTLKPFSSYKGPKARYFIELPKDTISKKGLTKGSTLSWVL